MLIRRLLPILFSHFLFNSFGQNTILVQDNFDAAKDDWYIYKTTGINLTYQSGKCIVNNTSGYLGQFVRTLPLDFSKNFSVELTLSFTKNFNLGYQSYASILFSQNNSRDFLRYTLYSGNSIEISAQKDTNQIAYFPFAFLAQTPLPASNTMKLEKNGNRFIFYINGKIVFQKENIHFPGNTLTLYLNNQSEIALDRFVVYQLNSGLRLPANLDLSQKKELLPPQVNSQSRMIDLYISPDGNYLYVNKRDDQFIEIYDFFACDDIWVSEKQKDGSWGQLKKMPSPINSIKSNDIVTASPDNNTLFMSDTNCYPSPYTHFWISHRTESGWSIPKAMKLKNGYNKSSYSVAKIAANGKIMLISFRRNDSWGQSDIYMCSRLNDSTWSEPKNLGRTINSLGSDFPCYIAPDDKTLYFASDGRIGYGGTDLYMTRRLDDTWTNWSEPENLGPNINGKGWDAYYCMDAAGEYAYFSSDNNNILPEAKFFRIKVPKEIKPNPIIMIKGKVLNIKTKQPVAAEIFYETLPEGKEAGVARSNPSTGDYKILLPCGKQYGYRAEAKGYITVNENFDLSTVTKYTEIEKDLYLVPIEVGQKITMNNVFFKQSKSELLPSSFPELNRLVQIMNDNPTMEIELKGHTDNQGDPQKNLILSNERVMVVRAYLIQRGISAKRITGQGFGGTQPLASNDTEESRKLNRRVEFEIKHK